MLKADAKRIAWFLDLRQILRFPKYFMAPSEVLRLGRRPAVSNPDAAAAGGLFFQGGLVTSRQPRSSAEHPQTAPNRIRLSIDGSGPKTTARFASNDASAVSRTRARSPAVSNSTPVTPRSPAAETYTAAAAADRPDPSGLQRTHRLIQVPVFGQAGLHKSPALAPTTFHSARGYEETTFNPDAMRIAAESRQSFAEQDLLLPSQPHSFSENIISQDQRASPKGSGTAGGNEPRHNPSSTGTLHIDGSALGRWAVQHLERALGKPATGMTGVDPRATTPRSRIAPF
jgi:hypothetical protein